jgi:hypothetical protein
VTVAVTGHRDLDPIEQGRVVGEVRQILSAISGEKRVLLSPLAVGADQWVAEVGLELGYELIVPMPFPLARYERDFDSAALLDRFRTLLKAASDYFAVVEEPTTSVAGYVAVGEYIVTHADILVALWDGNPTEIVGGTAHVVRLWRDAHAASVDPSIHVVKVRRLGFV